VGRYNAGLLSQIRRADMKKDCNNCLFRNTENDHEPCVSCWEGETPTHWHKCDSARIKEESLRAEFAEKSEGYTCQHPQINSMRFNQAWEAACALDFGLPIEDPTPKNLERAILSLARRVKELEHEWS